MTKSEYTITNVEHLASYIKEASDFAIEQSEAAIEIVALLRKNFSDFVSYDIYTKKLGGAPNPHLMTQKFVANFNIKGRKMVTVDIHDTAKSHKNILIFVTSQLDYEMRVIDDDLEDGEGEMIF